MSGLDTDENPEKEDIQDIEIHLFKINNNVQKGGCDSLVSRKTGGASALPIDPAKGRAVKQTIINVDRPSETSTMDRNMHD